MLPSKTSNNGRMSKSNGNHEQKLDTYRQVRDQLMAKIRSRFGSRGHGNE